MIRTMFIILVLVSTGFFVPDAANPLQKFKYSKDITRGLPRPEALEIRSFCIRMFSILTYDSKIKIQLDHDSKFFLRLFKNCSQITERKNSTSY